MIFHKGTFVKDVEIINVFASHPNGSKLKNLKTLLKLREGKVRDGRARYFGEYLTQGRLSISGKSASTNMRSLINAGLFKLEPRLEDKSKWEKLADTVVCLREPFDTPYDISVATHDEVRKAVSIAGACFGSHRDLPLTMMLLALKPRQTNDPVITGGIMTLFAGICQLACRRFIASNNTQRKILTTFMHKISKLIPPDYQKSNSFNASSTMLFSTQAGRKLIAC